MGLDFTHGDAHWAYSGFHRFRRRLAKTINIDLDMMAGFRYDWDAGKDYDDARKWNMEHPLEFLLSHSDCDGDLSPDLCRIIAPTLKEAVAPWDDDDYDKIMALRLAEGMELAAESGETLMFC